MSGGKKNNAGKRMFYLGPCTLTARVRNKYVVMGWREEAVVELPWEGDCCNGRVSPFRDTMGGRLWRWGGERGEKERGGKERWKREGEQRGGRERGGRER